MSRTRKKTWNRILNPIIGNGITIYFNVLESPEKQREKISTLTNLTTKFTHQHSNSNIGEKVENNQRDPSMKTLESVLLKTEESPELNSDNQSSEEISPLPTDRKHITIKLPKLKTWKEVESLDILSPIIQRTDITENLATLNFSRIDNSPEVQSSRLLIDSSQRNTTKRLMLNNISKAKIQSNTNISTKIRSIVWAIVFPFILERTVEKSTEKLRKESQVKTSKQIEDQSKVLIKFIEQHCGPALSKLYKTDNSCIVVDDGTIDEPIYEKELSKRFTTIMVNMILTSIKVIDEIN